MSDDQSNSSNDRTEEERLRALLKLAKGLGVDVNTAAAVALGGIFVSLAESLSLGFLSASSAFQQTSMTSQATAVRGVCEVLKSHRAGKVDAKELVPLLMKQYSSSPSRVTFPEGDSAAADAVLDALEESAARPGRGQ